MDNTEALIKCYWSYLIQRFLIQKMFWIKSSRIPYQGKSGFREMQKRSYVIKGGLVSLALIPFVC